MRTILLAFLYCLLAFPQESITLAAGQQTEHRTPATPVDNTTTSGCTGSSGAWTCTGTPTITLTDSEAMLIYYSLTTTPNCTGTGTLYTGAFAGSSSTFTLKAIGCNGITGGAVLTSVYTISGASLSAGIDFRATAGYVTDPTGDTYDIGAAYPVTRSTNGTGTSLTFGWYGSGNSNERDRSTGNDPRLAGTQFTSITSGATCASPGTDFWKWDLPNGAGTYKIALALGDQASAEVNTLVICDGANTIATFSAVSTGANNFMAANGTVYTEANWVSTGSTVYVTGVFSGTQMQLLLGTSSVVGFIAHVHLTQP